ncbi:MAG: hypothetical protein ACRC62_26030 [Microcoleus sp.]
MNNYPLLYRKTMALSPSQIEALVNYLGAASVVCGGIGSLSALGVDFMRRRVRAKAAEYAASNAFTILREDQNETHGVLQEFIKEYRIDRQKQREENLELVQRVAKLEAKIDA